jgi:hypothetical protein
LRSWHGHNVVRIGYLLMPGIWSGGAHNDVGLVCLTPLPGRRPPFLFKCQQ